MLNFNLKHVGFLALFASGCLGSEAGNPEPVAACESFMFGLVEGEFEVPENASAIPLQLMEWVNEGVVPSFELAVSMDGEPFTDFELIDEQGTVLDASLPITGIVTFRPTVALEQGNTLTMRRTLSCEQEDGGLAMAQPSEVVVKVGPTQPLPTTPGSLQVTDRAASTDVVLTMSEELVPWRHLVTQAELIADGTRLPGPWLTNDDDRSFAWSLSNTSCNACLEEENGSSDAPVVCQSHQWDAGQVELSVEVAIAGISAPRVSDSLSQTLEQPHCSH